MRRVASPGAVAAGLALVLIADAAILVSAGWNRRGGPRSEIVLTERELSVPEYREEENTGLALSLILGDEAPPGVERVAWRRRYRLRGEEHPWLDRAKLREIGFRADIDPSDPEAQEACEREGDRSVFLVLEFDGEAWRRWLASREERVGELRRKVESGAADRKEMQDAEALLALDRVMRSRLFPVDAGLDLESLRRRYPDRASQVVVRGIVSLAVSRPEEGAARLDTVLRVLPDRVHVPAGIRPLLLPFLPRETQEQVFERERKEPEAAWPAPAPPRYRAVLALGRRLEPWLVSVAPAGFP